MSTIVESLQTYAEQEKKAHQEYIKDFSTATIAHLVQGGVSRDKAAGLAKEACMRDETLIKSINRALILEKVAEYINSLESEVAKLQVKIDEMPVEKTAGEKEGTAVDDRLAALGLTSEELEALQDVPTTVLDKVASVVSRPWDLGKGVGPAVLNKDPLLAWIME